MELNQQFLREMTPERLEEYHRELQMVLAQTATFLAQVEEVLEQRNDQ